MHRLIQTLLPLAVILAAAQTLPAQNTLPADLRINGKIVWKAFEPQRQVLQASSAVIYTDGRSRIMKIYGTVVTEDGYILTKASEIEGAPNLSLRIGAELYRDVELVDVDPEWDVATLKITPASPLTPVRLGDASDAAQGTWVISNGSTTRSQRRVKVGVLGASTREVASVKRVILGVVLGGDGDGGLTLDKVAKDGGAAKAGLKKGDILRQVEGEKLTGRGQLLKILKGKKPGDKVAVQVERGGETKAFEVELKAAPGAKRMTRNDQMSGGKFSLSRRRSDFPRVMQHDTPLIKDRVGGPLLNLDGKCIGMNIARASRVATFAIPARELREIIARVKK